MTARRLGSITLGLLAAAALPAGAKAQGVAFQPIPGQFLDGATLGVTPVVSADRRYVRMSLNPQFNTLSGFQTINVPAAVGGGGNGGRNLGGLGGLGGAGGLGGVGGGGLRSTRPAPPTAPGRAATARPPVYTMGGLGAFPTGNSSGLSGGLDPLAAAVRSQSQAARRVMGSTTRPPASAR